MTFGCTQDRGREQPDGDEANPNTTPPARAGRRTCLGWQFQRDRRPPGRAGAYPAVSQRERPDDLDHGTREFDSVYRHCFVRVAVAVRSVRVVGPGVARRADAGQACQASAEHALLVVFAELGMS